MIRYILSGFELELFSAHEYPYLYWYLYELLFPWLTTCLHKSDSHLIEYEHYLENQTKSQGTGSSWKLKGSEAADLGPRSIEQVWRVSMEHAGAGFTENPSNFLKQVTTLIGTYLCYIL